MISIGVHLDRIIWDRIKGLTEYSEVPFEEIYTRPRYQHLKNCLNSIEEEIKSALSREFKNWHKNIRI